MSARTLAAFSTIRTEGALLPSDILVRVASGDKSLGGLEESSYHLAPGEKIGEATNRAWNRLQAAWANFQSAREKLAGTDTGTSLTRERWLLPLFQLLDYGRLQAAKAEEIGGKSYAISHAWQQTPIHLVGCNVDLDRRIQTAAGGMRSSLHSLLQELLNRSDQHLWGIVSNGLRLRLLRDNISLTRQAYVEFDLEAMMAGEAYPDFVLLWLLLHQSRFEAERTEQCQLEKWSQAARTEGVRVLDGLRDGVQRAIEHLGQGFLAHPSNAVLRENLRSGALDKQDYYRQILRLVYRLLFLFVADDRDLLLLPTADPVTQKRYRDFYATTRLRHLATTRAGSRHHDLYCGLKLVMEKLSGDGCPELALPALGSFLFSPRALPDLNVCEISNLHLLEAIRSLAVTQTGQSRRVVDYKNLGAEELGSVYESLLELHPDLNAEAATFELRVAAGSERKKTGSYYTPTSLISCLLDSALDPVLLEAAKQPEPEGAILKLKVVDPACGSGHFLIAAAHRIAKRLAAVRTGEEEPPPEAQRKAIRNVIGHCIYGVDVNPMAVELCKVSLWMEALEPGKPLSFLEHRIQCGNSLLGATPALLANGIPDEAFTPIEGDDKEICKEFKTINRDERNKQMRLFAATTEPWQQLGNFAASLMNLDTVGDDSIEAIRKKERMYEDAIRSGDYLDGNFWADTWCAAFVWKKTRAFSYPISEEVFRRIERNPHAVEPWMHREIERLAGECRFFHWHLAFPDVFHVPPAGVKSDDELTGWNGGFDLVIGNPPWIRQELLKGSKSLLSRFRSFSGTADLSVYFLEWGLLIARNAGRVAMLTPNKWFVADYGRPLRAFLRQNTRTELLVDFGHSKSLFPDADTFPACIVVERITVPAGNESPFIFVRAHDSERERNGLRDLVANSHLVLPHRLLKPERWQLTGVRTTSLLEKIQAHAAPLASVVGKPLYRGILTGFNEAFVIDGATRSALIDADQRSAEIIKPWLSGREVHRWTTDRTGEYVIFTRRGIDISSYPAIADHLGRWRDDLTPRRRSGDNGPGRKPGSYKWFEIQDNVAYHEEFPRPKIVFQEIAFHSQFALDNAGLYCNKTVHIVPSADPYILGVLNSRCAWWLLNHLLPHMKDGALLLQGSLMSEFPIPPAPPDVRGAIEVAVQVILADRCSPPRSEMLVLERHLSDLVDVAYGLTPDEREHVVETLPPRDPLVVLGGTPTPASALQRTDA